MKFVASDASEKKAAWKVVLRSSGADVAGELVAADEETGEYAVYIAGETKTVATYPGGIAIVPRGR